MSKDKIKESDACPYPPGAELPRKTGFGVLQQRITMIDLRITPVILVGFLLIAYSFMIPPPIPVQAPKDPAIFSEPYPTYDDSAAQPDRKWTPKYSKVITQKGNLYLSGDDELRLENCTFIFSDYIIVSGNARLVVKDAEIRYIAVFPMLTNPPGIDYPETRILFKDDSRLEANNLVTSHDGGIFLIAFIEQSSGDIAGSTFTDRIYFAGDSSVVIRNSKFLRGLSYNAAATLSIQNCEVNGISNDSLYGLIWNDRTYDLPELSWKNAKIDVIGSNINVLQVMIDNSNVALKDYNLPKAPMDLVSSQFCAGGEWLNLEVKQSTVKTLYLHLKNCHVDVERSRNLYVVLRDSNTRIQGSRDLSVDAMGGTLVLENSVLSTLFIGENADVTLSSSLIRFIDFGESTLTISQVRWEDYLIAQKVKLTRVYRVTVAADGKAIPQAPLTVKDLKGATVWEGTTDDSGAAQFKVTYNPEYPVKPFTWEDITVKTPLEVTTTVGQATKTQRIRSNSTSDVFFAFDKAPDPPLWKNRQLVQLGGGVCVVLSCVFVAYDWSRRRRATPAS